MCKQINNTKKRDQRIAREAASFAYANRRWMYSDIWEAYNKPSAAKVAAWEYCKRVCAEVNGHDLIISGRSSMVFSAVFKFEDNGKPCYGYITKSYDRYCYA